MPPPNILAPFSRTWARLKRRMWSAAPTSITPEADVAWSEPTFRYYATPQPYSSPLSLVHGNLTGETYEMRLAYRQWALQEPAVKASLLTKCLAVCQLDPQVIPADKRNPNDRAAAEWVKWALMNSDEGIPGLLMNLLLPATIDGFSVVEKVFGHVEARESRYAGWWTVKRFASIDTQWVRFKLDTYRQVTGVQAMTGGMGGTTLSPQDFVIFTHLKIFENPFGQSDIRAAVRACRLIDAAIRLRQILLANYSGPFLWSTARDTATRNLVGAALQNARANGWIVVPEGSTLTVENLATAAPDQFQAAIEDYRREIVTAIQGAYLQLLEGGITDGRGNTQVHRGIAELFQWWLATWVCQVINKQVIPDLVTPAFGDRVGLPRLQLGGLDADAVVKELTRFQSGHQLGITLSLDQVCETGGFEQPKNAADKLAPPQQQQQQPPGGGGGPGGGDPFAGLFGGSPPPPPPGPSGLPTVGKPPDGPPAPPNSDGALEFAEWHPYTHPTTGRSGWISSGGLVRYDDPRGGPAGPAADEARRQSRADAMSAVSAAIQNPERITDDHVPRLHEHMKTMTRDQLKQFVRQLGEKVGGRKAELADRLVAKVRSAQAGQPVQGQAIASAPEWQPPPPPPPAPTREQLVAAHVARIAPDLNSHPAMTNEATRNRATGIYQRALDTAAQAPSTYTAGLVLRDAGRELDAMHAESVQPRLARGQRTFTVARTYSAPESRRGWQVTLPSHPNVPLFVHNERRGRWVVTNGRTGTMVAVASNRDAALRALRLSADRRPEAIDPPSIPSLDPSVTPVPLAPRPPARQARRAPAGPETYVSPADLAGQHRAPNVPAQISASVDPRSGANAVGLFGRDVTTPEDRNLLAAAANAANGARVSVEPGYGGGINVETRGEGYTASRTFRRDRQGNLFVHNNYFRVNFDRNPSPPPEWVQSNREISGSKLLNNQIAALAKLGVKYIETDAARQDSTNPNNGMNGYYTWPRLGYDAEIPSDKYRLLPAHLKQLVEANALGSEHSRSILNLMTTAEGRDWWKKNGDWLHGAVFDLTPGSLSMRVAEAYQKEQAAARAARGQAA